MIHDIVYQYQWITEYKTLNTSNYNYINELYYFQIISEQL